MCWFSHWSTAARVCTSLLNQLPIGWSPVCPCRVASFIQRLGGHPSLDRTGVHQVFFVDSAIFPQMSRCSVPLCRKSFSALWDIFLSNWVGGRTLACLNPLTADGFPIVGACQWGHPCIIQSVADAAVQWYHMEAMQGFLWRCLSTAVLNSCLEGWRCVPPPELQVDLYPSLLSPASVVPLKLVTMISCSLVLGLLRTAGQ